MVIPSRLKSPGRLSNTEIRIGSIAEVSAVALAKPRWITMRKAPRMAKMPSGPTTPSPVWATTCAPSHCPAWVVSNTVPRLIPTPKTITVPQGTRVWTSFQFITPMRGSIRITRPA